MICSPTPSWPSLIGAVVYVAGASVMFGVAAYVVMRDEPRGLAALVYALTVAMAWPFVLASAFGWNLAKRSEGDV